MNRGNWTTVKDHENLDNWKINFHTSITKTTLNIQRPGNISAVLKFISSGQAHLPASGTLIINMG